MHACEVERSVNLHHKDPRNSAGPLVLLQITKQLGAGQAPQDGGVWEPDLHETHTLSNRDAQQLHCKDVWEMMSQDMGHGILYVQWVGIGDGSAEQEYLEKDDSKRQANADGDAVLNARKSYS